MWSQNVRRLDMSLLPHRLWPAGLGGCWERGTGAAGAATIIGLRSCSGEALLQGLLSPLALARPAGDLHYALLHRRLG